MLKEIFRERRRELMGEGHRWFDRIREARTVGDDDAMIKLINEGGIYWPIAEEVLERILPLHKMNIGNDENTNHYEQVINYCMWMGGNVTFFVYGYFCGRC